MKDNGAEINSKDEDDMTPLNKSAENCHLGDFKSLDYQKAKNELRK